jgi:hypothetical protein
MAGNPRVHRDVGLVQWLRELANDANRIAEWYAANIEQATAPDEPQGQPMSDDAMNRFGEQKQRSGRPKGKRVRVLPPARPAAEQKR